MSMRPTTQPASPHRPVPRTSRLPGASRTHRGQGPGALVLALLASVPACVTFEGASHQAAPPAAAMVDETGPTPATVADLSVFEDDVRRILAASLGQGRAYARLVELVHAAPSRLAGSPGADAAVAWAERAMREDGLENVRLQPVTVPHWERGEVASLHVVSGAAAPMALRITALGGSVATPEGGLSAPVIEVRSFEELERRSAEVEGCIVFFNRPMDASLPDTFAAYGGAVDQRSRGAVEAARHGGVAAIVRSMTTRIDDSPHTGAMRYADGVPRVPGVAVSTLGAERLASRIATHREVFAHLEVDSAWHADAPGHNVIGELVGRELPDQILVVGGHLDAWDIGQGAHDDGAGCVQAIEALRLLRSLDLHPRRTLRAVLFANEENGLAGGRAYRDGHVDELERHVLALESDRGGFTPRGFTTNANPAAFEVLQAAAALLVDAGADRMIEGGGGADIGPMRDDGVVLVGYLPDGQRYFDVHHSENDTLDQVSARELNLGAGVIAAMLWMIAELDETLPRNPTAGEAPGG